MRSIAEIAFRARQEAANLYLLLAPPQFSGKGPDRLALPDAGAIAAALRGAEYAEFVELMARNVLAHYIPLLGVTIETGAVIQWRRDYQHARETGSQYFRRIPYLDFATAGDHKWVWELNRHQHLILLAQAYVLTRADEFAIEIWRQLESWFEQNPFQRGINWASALEVAFRALSWIWIYHLSAPAMPDAFKRRFVTAIYRHGRHLAENLSVYFSPNTHLLGEAVALYALGTLFGEFPESGNWRRRAAQIVEAQLVFQVRPDGSHFEQSSYYHVYALDFFLFYYLLAGRPVHFEAPLGRMAEYLEWLLGPGRRISFVGDDDGGRLFHPFGDRSQFGRATLTTCGLLWKRERWIGPPEEIAEQAAWWLGPACLEAARLQPAKPAGAKVFPDAGVVFLQSESLYLQMDVGPFGWGGAGHSHADTLSLLVWLDGVAVFLDPGTFTYVADPIERSWFRSSPAHNTVSIDGRSQGEMAGPFRWSAKPEVHLNDWKPSPEGGYVDAVCRYEGFEHRRRVLLRVDGLLVLDELQGPDGEHDCWQVWQLGPAADKVCLSFSSPVSIEPSQLSPVYGTKVAGRAMIAKTAAPLPLSMAMRLDLHRERPLTAAEAREAFEHTEAGESGR
ncbi:MAG TPA: alginate lyase family protein [Bryobacteraceae bacterium]